MNDCIICMCKLQKYSKESASAKEKRFVFSVLSYFVDSSEQDQPDLCFSSCVTSHPGKQVADNNMTFLIYHSNYVALCFTGY